MDVSTVMFQFAAPVYDQEPWKRAFSFSFTFHGGLLLLALLLSWTHHQMPLTVLTEVKFVEQPPVVAGNQGAPAPVAPGRAGGGGGQALKSKMEVNASGNAPLGTSNGSIPGGKGNGPVGASRPLSAPIATMETLGWVGKKQAGLMEMSHRAGGTAGSGWGKGVDSGPLQEPMALSKMGVDEIRKKESSLGAPLISAQVGTGGGGGAGGAGAGIGSGTGKGKQLALGDLDLGQKRKTRVESLKDNPLDQDKWGKQGGPFSMEGPLKYRKIIRMDLPAYPRWAEEKGIEASVSIRLWVDPKGVVKENMYLEKTSGYSELDRTAMDALRRFVFVSIPNNLPQDDEWGVATFRFELKH